MKTFEKIYFIRVYWISNTKVRFTLSDQFKEISECTSLVDVGEKMHFFLIRSSTGISLHFLGFWFSFSVYSFV